MKNILIMGLGKSGMGAAKLLTGSANLSVYDAKTEDQINKEDIALLKLSGITCYFACDPVGPFDQVVVSPSIPMDNPILCKCKEDGAEVIGEIELAYNYCEGEFIAITGSNGKTTVTTLVGEIIKAAEIPCEVVGNIGLAVSEECKNAKPGTIMVTEVSSFQMETIKDFHPHISAILNLSPDHLDRHKTYENYIAAKARVCENQVEGDYFIYNYNDPKTAEIADKLNGPFVVPFSSTEDLSDKENSAYVKEGSIVVNRCSMPCVLCKATDLQIPGKHNLENALAAAAIAVFAGAAPKVIKKTLKSFKGVEHRMEFVREYKGVRYINDSKGTNPDASVKALEATDTPIILIAGGYDKHLEFDDYIKAFDGKVQYLLLIGATAQQIADTAIKYGFPDDRIIKLDSMKACIATAARFAEKGDTVLLSPACASWGMYDNFEQRGEEFKALVKDL